MKNARHACYLAYDAARELTIWVSVGSAVLLLAHLLG